MCSRLLFRLNNHVLYLNRCNLLIGLNWWFRQKFALLMRSYIEYLYTIEKGNETMAKWNEKEMNKKLLKYSKCLVSERTHSISWFQHKNINVCRLNEWHPIRICVWVPCVFFLPLSLSRLFICSTNPSVCCVYFVWVWFCNAFYRCCWCCFCCGRSVSLLLHRARVAVWMFFIFSLSRTLYTFFCNLTKTQTYTIARCHTFACLV